MPIIPNPSPTNQTTELLLKKIWNYLTGVANNFTPMELNEVTDQLLNNILLSLPPGGVGTVTSVGLSAPSNDFIVSGSPVTTNGVLTFNWLNGILHDTFNLPSLDFYNHLLKDINGNDSIDYGFHLMYDNLGFQAISYLNGNRLLFDATGNVIYDFGIQKMYDSFFQVSFDHNERKLIDNTGSTISINWNTRQQSNSSGNVTLNYEQEVLYDSFGVTSFNWEYRQFFDSFGNLTIDTNNHQLLNTSGNISNDFGAHLLCDQNGQPCIEYDTARLLVSASGVNVAKWGDTYLQVQAGVVFSYVDAGATPPNNVIPVITKYFGTSGTTVLGVPSEWMEVFPASGIPSVVPVYAI